ncbi:fimbrillin family protein [Bacteroides sp. 519]|uniref:fimbrillin family protein n=1 Tax=Bacteroides sp. 519 TaxID=2302937 RepID=UPI0013D64CCC|nr:fimbrillin family protein [Bacteroides sp. 519]NDV60572.1 fimbrillin family protein [Bacteroides sp. 519]
MNRIRYIYGIIIVVAVCSCQKDIDALPNYIEFGAIHKFVLRSAETRAATDWGGTTTADFNGTMKLYGMYDGTGASTFINGDNVEVTGGQNTTYKKVWPNATSTYKFFAFYPSDAMTVATDASNLKCTVNSASGYTIGANASTHKDLMYASRENPTHGAKFDLVFHHLLTRVTFQVSRATDFPEKEIESITLTGVRDTYEGETQSGSTEEDDDDSKFTWTRVGNTTNSPCMNATNTPGSPSIFPYKLTTTSTLLNDNFFLFPQTVSESGKEIKLQLKLKDEATPIEVDLSDTGIDWGMGEWINYILTFNQTGEKVTIAAQILPWTSSGVDGDALGRKLNLSETEVNFYKLNGTLTASNNKVYFWTNQKDAYIEEDMLDSKTKVNSIFKDLNFEFDDDDGWGHFTLDFLSNSAAVGEYNIVLNVGGLRKKIQINILDLTLDFEKDFEKVAITKKGYPDDVKADDVEIEFETDGTAAYIEEYFYYRDLKTNINNIFEGLSAYTDDDGTSIPASNFVFNGPSPNKGKITFKLKHFGKDGGYIILNIQKGTARIREKIQIEMKWDK